VRLECYKTLWGHAGGIADACQQARVAGFAGVEGPAPASRDEQSRWREQLQATGLLYIAEICTAGSYVPDRTASVRDHILSLEEKLQHALALSPQFITCIGGCDAWSEEQSLEFFTDALRIARECQACISFETHRSRSFFNPWVTARICAQLSELRITADFSHWCVVCERLMDAEQDVLEQLAGRVHHIHARVGYEQGPQVTDPRLARYQRALESHESCWRRIWERQGEQGFARSTMTPEFGPDGYQQVDPFSSAPVGDLWEMNCWMAQRQQRRFNEWHANKVAVLTEESR
jgi:sugar phosphate isomerase/epimerase